MALGWKGGYALPRAREASEAALRFSGKLPTRERALVVAYQMFSYGKLAAVDSMRKYVVAYPDDIEGWNLLGETQFHTRQLTGLTPSELVEPFDRVLALDSSLTPSAIHPLETMLATGDSAGFFRYLALFRRGASSSEADAYAAAGALVWGGGPPDSTAAGLLQQHMGATTAALMEAQTGPRASGTLAVERFGRATVAARGVNPGDQQLFQIAMGRALLFAGLGRFEEAARLEDSLSKFNPQQAGAIYLGPVMLGIAPDSYGKTFLEGLERAPINNPFVAYFRAAILLSRGDAQRAGHILDSAVHDSLTFPDFLRGAYVGALGWRALMVGDTTTGIRLLRTGAERLGGNSFFSAPLRLQLGAALAARPDSRDQGLKLLHNGFLNDLGALPVAYFALGRAAEAAGHKDEAIFGYGQFVRLWDKADSSAKYQVQAAKEGLIRLTGEPKN